MITDDNIPKGVIVHEEILACPFCAVKLEYVAQGSSDGSDWAEHPHNNCFMSGWEFDAFDVKKWNRRDGG